MSALETVAAPDHRRLTLCGGVVYWACEAMHLTVGQPGAVKETAVGLDLAMPVTVSGAEDVASWWERHAGCREAKLITITESAQDCPAHKVPLVVVYDRPHMEAPGQLEGFERHCIVCLLERLENVASKASECTHIMEPGGVCVSCVEAACS